MILFSDVSGGARFDVARKHNIRARANLLDAAEMHILWKTQLEHHVQGSICEPVEPLLVGQGGFCQLGMWINSSESGPFRGLPEFDQLHEAHQKFHQSGALIIEKLHVGHRSEAALIFKNEYNQALRRIVQSLTDINKHLQQD